MEQEIKITVIPKEQIGKSMDAIRITYGDVCVWGYSLREAISEFDREFLRDKN